MSSECFSALEGLPVPDFDGVVSQARDNLIVVVLKAVNTFTLLALAVDSGNGASSVSPIAVDFSDILVYGWAKPSEETIGSRSL